MTAPNKMILVYEEFQGYGRGLYTISWPWLPDHEQMLNEQNATWVICDQIDPSTIYVDLADQTVHTKTDGPWTVVTGSSIPADGAMEWLINNLPVNTQVLIGNETYQVTDGDFAFASDIPGSFKITVRAWPFLESSYEVTFV